MGPWFTKMNYMVTSDPMNVHHIMSKNFDNYVKGPEFREIFHAFGDGIVAADFETWKYIRTLQHFLFRRKSFEKMTEETIRKKVQNGLIPIFDHACFYGKVLDIQDVFSRLMFDETSIMVLGRDPKSLSIEFPLVEAEKAFDEIEESIFFRHSVPTSVWKFQEWLQIGHQEKKMAKACKNFDQFLYSCIATRHQELSTCIKSCNNHENCDNPAHQFDDLISAMMMMNEKNGKVVHDDKFLRDSAFNLFVAGRDTITSGLTWFFWLVVTHPSVEAKILEEIEENFGGSTREKYEILGSEDLKKLVYLHGALCESLRLFPPVPIERKKPLKCDTLPSGHHVNPNTIVLLFSYAMARLKEIWGEDCLEFKPERWISEKGDIIRVPSYKFVSFNSGPRSCLGKDLSFVQMKMVASTILRNYCIQVVENHPTTKAHSIVLLMKHGLKVMITKRNV
ncbi:hypothetical protein PIB30_036583 [Stylosanthes scabra]|uniref:Alkane hydroxylase MAH1-like n=1 Tax=Stylosanthes scabra TaxID=79078 RepID=A0ABU6YAQ8_9FABA|nr:hypothetical protein [Stylosanthes scabra]